MLSFGALHLSVLLWVFPLVILFYIWADRKRIEMLGRFAETPILTEINKASSARKKNVKALLVAISLLFMLIAALRPQWGFSWHEVKRQGLDILIAIDTSNSMLAEDVKPNRLERAKLAIRDMAKKLKGDRVGLIAFSGTAFLQCPLTIDYNGFLLSLGDVQVDSIPVGGTSIASAINTALGSYGGGKKKNKILIVITDGEDLEGDIDRAVARAKAAGMTIFCVGIGTKEGELIPIRDKSGKMGFLKDDEGNLVRTKLDEKVLEQISLATGGMYVRSTGLEFGLDLIYDEKLSKMEKEEIKNRMEKTYNERFQIALAAALAILFIEMFIGDRRKQFSAYGNFNDKKTNG